MTALRLALLVLAGIWGAAPCFAQAVEQVVWWPLVSDGQEYRRVPYPQEAGAILVLADTDVVLDARFAPVAYWPITREYLADLSQQPRSVAGSIEIVDAAGEVIVVEPEAYVVWHPMGVGAGPAQLVHGAGVAAFYENYLGQARAAAAAEREYQRILGLHQAALEAWLRMAAERRGQGMPAPPPELDIERPEPFHAFASEPRDAAVLSLPAGRYTVRVRDAAGEIVPGSERELVSFGPLGRAVGYVLRPEDRWTQPATSFAPDESIYTTGQTDLFLEPVPVVAYDAERHGRLFRPQSVAADGSPVRWTADLQREVADDAALAVWHRSALVETLPRTPWRVAQLAGTARGYVIEPFEAQGRALEADFHAMRLPQDVEVTRIDLVAGDGAEPVHASRRFRKVSPWPEPLLFLPALLPLAAGLALRVAWRRRFAR